MSEATAILRRGDEQLEIPAEEWPKVLLRAEDWGWRFEQKGRLYYLVKGTKVAPTDAAGLSKALQKILDAMLTKPLETCLIDVKMEHVYQVAEFCKPGGFTIERVPPKGFYSMDEVTGNVCE